MAFILAIIGALTTASIWWLRMRSLHRAASDVIDLAGRAKGNYKRKKFSQTAGSSPITAIDDPIVAAATLLCEIATTDVPVIGKQEQIFITKQICQITNKKAANEAVIYGAWAVCNVSDASLVILRLGTFLRDKLNSSEKQQLLKMIIAARRDIEKQLPIKLDESAFENQVIRLKKYLCLEIHGA